MPYKDQDKQREYQRNWDRLNKDKRRKSWQKYNNKHPKRNQEYYQRLKRNRPWMLNLLSAKNRCYYAPKDSKQEKYYQQKGIKCLLTEEQIKTLWFRDNADKMFRPSLDRINKFKDYTFNNCRFIELKDNTSRKIIFTEEEQKVLLTAKVSKHPLIQSLYQIIKRRIN
jgi:hypothetical protein